MNPSSVTLAQALGGSAVDFDTLRRRHGPLLEIGRKLLGVVPNCHQYLEIWPPGFRTYNLLVPNFLNVPFLLLGSNPLRETVGIVMYTASRAAECSYCSAHSCSFALRRGVTAEKVTAATTSRSEAGIFNERDLAAIQVADSLGRVPCTLSDAQRAALLARFSAADVEWLVLAIAMMGFLNKFMDAMGVPLEDSVLREAEPVIASAGWRPGKHLAGGPEAQPRVGHGERPLSTDSIATLLGLAPLLPSVLRRDRQWTSGMPGAWPAVGACLRERTGYDFPILSKLTHPRAIRGLATILRDNTDANESQLGLRAKHLAGVAYANVVQDDQLTRAASTLASSAGANKAQLSGSSVGLDEPTIDAIGLARAASSSPAQIGREDIAAATQHMSPPAIIELIVWISVLQLLHRLHGFYDL